MKWPQAGTSIFVPEYDYFPDHDEIVKVNGGAVKFYGLKGFTVGSYSEFLIGDIPVFAGYQMGEIEVSFGQSSPLMAYLFSGPHREKYFGLWENIYSARVSHGAGVNPEIAFLNAAMRYFENYHVLPDIFEMSDDFLYSELDEASDQQGEKIFSGPPCIADVDVLRSFYNGLSQSDDIAACIYFYRVIEYYSFFTNMNEIAKARHDISVNLSEFTKKMIELISRDEKGPVIKLIKLVEDKQILEMAIGLQLGKEWPSTLGEAVYAFRNSIVHGKYGSTHAISSGSLLGTDEQFGAWRSILRGLAERTISRFGAKI